MNKKTVLHLLTWITSLSPAFGYGCLSLYPCRTHVLHLRNEAVYRIHLFDVLVQRDTKIDRWVGVYRRISNVLMTDVKLNSTQIEPGELIQVGGNGMPDVMNGKFRIKTG